MGLLDPWRDAADIARRLQSDGAIFVVVIAAQSWCQKCRDIYPIWLDQTQKLTECALWLDLDEHQEFVGDFVPDDLPWLLIYRGDSLVVSEAVLNNTLATLAVKLQALQSGADEPLVPDPGIRARLLYANWAQS
jgi:hypothetical protein